MSRYKPFNMSILAVLLCLLVVLPGNTQAGQLFLAQQISAPEHFTAQYQSATGKSIISVNAKVFVPAVDKVSTYTLRERFFTPADAWALARSAKPEDTWLRLSIHGEGSKATSERLYLGDENAFERSSALDGNLLDSLFLFQSDFWDGTGAYNLWKGTVYDPYTAVHITNWSVETIFGVKPVMRKLNYGFSGGYNHPYYSADGADIQMMQEAAAPSTPGQALSLLDAEDLANDLVQRAFPEFTMTQKGLVEGQVTYHKAGTKEYRDVKAPRLAYGFFFTRAVDGIPVTRTNTNISTDEQALNQAMSAPPGYESIAVIVDEGQVVQLIYNDPYVILDKLIEDVKLLPFSKIMDIFGTMAPLSIQTMENEHKVMGGSGNRWDITSIHLGYMPVRQKDNPDIWELRPVWDFFGKRAFAREVYDWPGLTALTIDAIDGTVIDRNVGY